MAFCRSQSSAGSSPPGLHPVHAAGDLPQSATSVSRCAADAVCICASEEPHTAICGTTPSTAAHSHQQQTTTQRLNRICHSPARLCRSNSARGSLTAKTVKNVPASQKQLICNGNRRCIKVSRQPIRLHNPERRLILNHDRRAVSTADVHMPVSHQW